MNDNDVKKTIQWLTEKWGDRPCPMCGAISWQVESHAYQMMEFSDGNLVVGGPVMPLIPVICRHCGNTILVNAILCGVVKNEKKEQKNDGTK